MAAGQVDVVEVGMEDVVEVELEDVVDVELVDVVEVGLVDVVEVELVDVVDVELVDVVVVDLYDAQDVELVDDSVAELSVCCLLSYPDPPNASPGLLCTVPVHCRPTTLPLAVSSMCTPRVVQQREHGGEGVKRCYIIKGDRQQAR